MEEVVEVEEVEEVAEAGWCPTRPSLWSQYRWAALPP